MLLEFPGASGLKSCIVIVTLLPLLNANVEERACAHSLRIRMQCCPARISMADGGQPSHNHIQGLLQRGVKPDQIILAVPGRDCHVKESYDEIEVMNEDLPFIYPDAFDDE